MNAPVSSQMIARTAALILLVFLSACASGSRTGGGPPPHYKVGNPYKIKGRWYYPKHDPDYEKVGVASWYGRQFHGRKTANGEVFDMNRLSAAHTTLPLPSVVEVTNLENGRKLRVRVNDRGPFAKNRVIDMSRAAARYLGFEQAGTARVRVRYLGLAQLAATAPAGVKDQVALADAATTNKFAPPVAAEHPDLGAPTSSPTNPNSIAVAAAPSLGGAQAVSGPGVSPDAPLPETPSPKPTLALNRDPDIAAIEPSADDQPTGAPGARAEIETETIETPVILPATVETEAPATEEGAIIDLSKAPASALESLFVIRVAALSRLDNIETLKQQLADVGPLRVSRVEIEGGAPLYRITMGPFVSAEAALEPLEAVRAAGYDDAKIVTLTP